MTQRTNGRWRECFDLDNWEYGSDFGAPIDYSSGEAVAVIQGDLLDRAGLGALPFAVGFAGKPARGS